MNNIKRGDIFYADLTPIKGSEQGGERPVMVLQNNVGNHHSPTLIVVAITTKRKNELPTHVYLKDTKFLSENSIVLLEQLRTIDRVRLGNYICNGFIVKANFSENGATLEDCLKSVLL